MIETTKINPDSRNTSDGVAFLQDAFSTEQECLFTNLSSSRRVRHNGDRGEVNEMFFIQALRRCLPDRYTVDKASVLDSTGEVSDSIDVVVFDRQYTPTLLDSDNHRYVPAESVYAVFECKPKIDKGYLGYAADKAASVRKLVRTSMGVMTIDGPKPPRPLHDIIAGILAINVDWADGLGESFKSCHETLHGDHVLDCGFAASGASFDIFKDGNLTFGPSGNAWAFFIFRLLDRLRDIGTAPAVDWATYANALSFSNQEGVNDV